MRPAHVATTLPAHLPDQLPLRLEQRAANVAPLLALALLLPIAAAVLMPFMVLAQAWIAVPEVRTLLAEHPISGLQLALAFTFWSVLFAWPIKRIADQIARTRSVQINDGVVSVTDRSLMSTTTWSEPLSRFSGVSHHVRSSLSGVRHELILDHMSDASRSVLITIAPRMSDAEISYARGLFGSHSSPSRQLYQRLQQVYVSGNSEQIDTPERSAA